MDASSVCGRWMKEERKRGGRRARGRRWALIYGSRGSTTASLDHSRDAAQRVNGWKPLECVGAHRWVGGPGRAAFSWRVLRLLLVSSNGGLCAGNSHRRACCVEFMAGVFPRDAHQSSHLPPVGARRQQQAHLRAQSRRRAAPRAVGDKPKDCLATPIGLSGFVTSHQQPEPAPLIFCAVRASRPV